MSQRCRRVNVGPVAGLLAWSLATVALATEPATIEGPRPAGHVVDTVGLLPAEDVSAIEQFAAGIEAASGGDLVVVVMRTTGGRPHRSFATELFNRWRLGSAERNDGLLIFVAVDDRKAEIVLGDGVDDPPRLEASRTIMEEVLIPEFKAGRPAAGLRKAAFLCGTRILSAAAETPVPNAATAPAAGAGAFVPAPAEAVPPPAWAPPPRPQSDRLLPLAVTAGGTAGGAGLSWYLMRRHLRNRPRQCPTCGVDMVRLGELADDAHLLAGQRTEEQLRSVDYDVWTCPTCPHVTALRYGAFFTSHAKCRGCGFVTRSTTVNRVRSPTTWASGLESITERCKHCGHTSTSTRIIPKLKHDRDNSFFSSSSSSSSSSGFGGGSSSGSGASGSW